MGNIILEQDFTGDGTLDLKADNGIMWIQVNRDPVEGIKGFIDEGGVSGQNNFLDNPIYCDGMVDQIAYWRTESFGVQIEKNTPDIGIYKVTSIDIGNGKEVTKEFTVTLEASNEYALIDYRFTNSGSASWTYDEHPGHIHDGAMIGTVSSTELYDIDAYINGFGVINLTSLGWWQSYTPDPSAPFYVLYRPSSGEAVTFGFKSWDYPIHQIVSYYTGASPMIEPHLDVMATQFTLAPGASAEWKAVAAFHNGGYSKGIDIYQEAVPPPQQDCWTDGFETYSPGVFPRPPWIPDGNAETNPSANYVDNSVSYEGANSLRIFGLINSCWGALAYRPLSVSPPYEIELTVRNGNETTGGCHPDRVYIGLRKGFRWWNPARTLVEFMRNGTIRSSSGNILGTYSTLTWYNLKIRYERPSPTEVQISYWIDGDFKGTEILPLRPEENNLTNLDLTVQEGTVWYDNVKVCAFSPRIEVDLDIKPQSCPNPLNTENKGVLPVAILGSADFDITEIDVSTIRLGGVSPIRSNVEDVSTPVNGEPCECTEEGPDGFDDLALKFDTQDIVETLGEINDGDEIELTLTGALKDGTPIEGRGCVIITPVGGGPQSGGIRFEDSKAFGLQQNFPNPFIRSTVIRYQIPQHPLIKGDNRGISPFSKGGHIESNMKKVRLEVFDAVGRLVETIVDERQEPGVYQVQWKATEQPSGIYFYRLTVVGAIHELPLHNASSPCTETRKMILLR